MLVREANRCPRSATHLAIDPKMRVVQSGGKLPVPHLPFDLEDQIHKLEPLVRYSGVNQRAVVADEISTRPEVGFNGSPSIFAPHGREIALGLDYWIEPSIVWQTEFDLELPKAGGTLLSFNGKNQPTVQGIGATPNDRAILTQIAIGF